VNSVFTDYYGLSFNPFDKQCVKEKDCFQSKGFKEMSARLSYVRDVRGIGVFTAQPGMGKSLGLRRFAKELNPNLGSMERLCLGSMERLCLSTVGIREFYHMLCTTLGIEPRGSKPAMFRAVQEQVYYLYHEKHKPLCLAVDECQYLSPAILNDLKLIMNHGYDSLNCFTLILCGESYFNRTLSKPVNEALRQRVVAHYDFQGLDDGEAPLYIRHKIQSAGGSASILEESALSAACGYAQGNPRIIDNLMTDALMIGAQTDKTAIDTEVILAAANNQQL